MAKPSLTPNFDASALLGLQQLEGIAVPPNRVTLTDLPDDIFNLLQRSYPRGASDKRTAFVVNAIRQSVAAAGGRITSDGRLVPAPAPDQADEPA